MYKSQSWVEVVGFAMKSSNPWYSDSHAFLKFLLYLWKQQKDFKKFISLSQAAL